MKYELQQRGVAPHLANLLFFLHFASWGLRATGRDTCQPSDPCTGNTLLYGPRVFVV